MNKVILIGRLVKDVEEKYTQTNNTLVATFTLAVNRRFVKDGEERMSDFFNIIAWGKLGEFCSNYYKKGQQVAIVGRLQTRNWEDEQKRKHYITEIIAEEAYFADTKKDSDKSNTMNSNSKFDSDEENDFEIIPSDDLPF